LKDTLPEAVTIFVLAPSRQELEKRLRSRSEDPDQVIVRRLNDAAREIRNYDRYDYVVVNDDLERSAKTLAAIVTAERVRRTRIEDQLRPILETFEEKVER
jgi:guanylate kinase